MGVESSQSPVGIRFSLSTKDSNCLGDQLGRLLLLSMWNSQTGRARCPPGN